ncbi:von Willebrand factor A domain-containing protein 7 isoform X1 [Brienomyrus brachyistius]|uniref:von Willebrand factor A domain-containing protein 7 isoform X1 n=1 Tax=Brienomyrus brachyistius TaxID=42636 RepID=UPI0020B343BC|nr:von Willebrand factor A domain-containing protein 7 isoform X1 [Brienomyrus brachyistius]XP_048836897.1 von Willebrand factor A domain-containing protein 7 isoform X1 [Brienomyrus brachyistius]
MPHPRLCVFSCLLLLLPGHQAFLPNFWSQILTMSWSSHTHQYMTEQALLNVTLATLGAMDRDIAGKGSCRDSGRLTASPPLQDRLGREFWHAVGEVVRANAAMDFLSATRSDPVYHFDSEHVEEAAAMLREFWVQTLFSVQAKKYQGARQSLGQLLHSLQDFYSHSNWVEMGQRSLYLHLLHPEEPSIPVASEDTPTCTDCYTSSCRNNILSQLTEGQHTPLLTTGYFSTQPKKPPGKCSHGGILDSSRHHGAQGGINKDSTSPFFSPHHYLHEEAAQLATAATRAVLLDLREAVGASSFLRLFSVGQQPALVFVMDTTGSMFEEITAARLRALSIIRARAKDQQQPSTFILVPFHDPGVGPVYETDNPEQFMRHMESLLALGGGDEPEMCFSAVLLALTHSPPLSEVFVFTDASPKDAHLYDAVEALMREKQCKVSFLLTEDLSSVGWRREIRRVRQALSPERFSLYYKLSSVSGGLTIATTNSDIQKVSAIVQDNISAGKVTLLHVDSDSVSTSSHSFHVDRAVKSVMVHLAGVLKSSILTSPTGRTQSLLEQRRPLAHLEMSHGLYRISLLPPIEQGTWRLHAESDGHITIQAIGDSSVDFLYYFAVLANGTHPGLARVQGTPVAGVPTFLVLSIIGLSPDDKASISHVTLVGSRGESLLVVPLNSSSSSSSSSEELVGRIDSMPREPFSLRLSGRDGRGNRLERVSTEMIQPTHVQIQVLSIPLLIPGETAMVRFDLWNHGPARQFTLTAEDDHGFLLQKGPHRLSAGEGGRVRGEVLLKTPNASEAGEGVTLTLSARALDTADSNYAVVRLSVVVQDHDATPPTCLAIHVEASCTADCSRGRWTSSLRVVDRGRAGLAALQVSEGRGNLSIFQEGGQSEGGDNNDLVEPRVGHGQTKLDVPAGLRGRALKVSYTSSCCFPQAELLVWDRAENMKRCHLSASQQGAIMESTSAVWRTEITLFVMLLSILWPILM